MSKSPFPGSDDWARMECKMPRASLWARGRLFVLVRLLDKGIFQIQVSTPTRRPHDSEVKMVKEAFQATKATEILPSDKARNLLLNLDLA